MQHSTCNQFVTTKRPEESLAKLHETFLRVDYSFGGLNRNR